MPSSRSSLSLSERRNKAFDLYTRGYTVTDVARELRVSPNTAARYKRSYEESIKEQVQTNPQLLSEVLANTIRNLSELDQIRAEAWKRYEKAKGDTARQGYMNTMIKAQSERAKLFGLLGVKQEYYKQVEEVRAVQERLVQFMREQLCTRDRQALEAMLHDEFPQYMQDARPAVIEIEAQAS